jgi:hypothetical protein
MSKRINVYIQNESTWEDFKHMVKKKYGVLHTNLGLELEKSMIRSLHMEGEEGYEKIPFDESHDDNSSEKIWEHTHKINKTVQKLCDFLYTNFEKDASVPFLVLAKFMTETCGVSNPRTHQNHVRSLLLLKVIAQSDGYKKYVKYDILSEELVKFVSPAILVEGSS